MDKRIQEAINASQYIYNDLFDDTITDTTELDGWLMASKTNEEVYRRIIDNDGIGQRLDFYQSIDIEKEWSLFEMRKSSLHLTNNNKSQILHLYRRIAAIAAILLIPLLLIFILQNREIASLEYTLLDGESILPGSTLATLITDCVNLNIDESMIVSAKDGIDVADKTGNSLLTVNTVVS